LVSLEIIKHLLGLSDEQLEHAYLFDFRVRNAGLGRETLGDNICQKRSPISADAYWNTKEETQSRPVAQRGFQDHRSYLKTNLRSMRYPADGFDVYRRLTSSNSLRIDHRQSRFAAADDLPSGSSGTPAGLERNSPMRPGAILS